MHDTCQDIRALLSLNSSKPENKIVIMDECMSEYLSMQEIMNHKITIVCDEQKNLLRVA
jgi:hypothetical protein